MLLLVLYVLLFLVLLHYFKNLILVLYVFERFQFLPNLVEFPNGDVPPWALSNAVVWCTYEDTLMWHHLWYTYLYNKIQWNEKLHKMILFHKHKGVHVGKRFTFALITKLKIYQLRVWKHFRLKTKSSKTSYN